MSFKGDLEFKRKKGYIPITSNSMFYYGQEADDNPKPHSNGLKSKWEGIEGLGSLTFRIFFQLYSAFERRRSEFLVGF